MLRSFSAGVRPASSISRLHALASSSRLFSSGPVIAWTKTDEAPALATRSFLPIVQAFTASSGVAVKLRDISLAARILASFPETNKTHSTDVLAELGALCKQPQANIVKLPNISASVPQLHAAIAELRQAGFDVPLFPESPTNDKEVDAAARYSRVLGSAVNPVLREGNSDRRAPSAVKQFARANPHSMGKWSSDSKTHVASMQQGDFFSNEESVTFRNPTTVRIEFEPVDAPGKIAIWRDDVVVQSGEIVDASFMSKSALCAFLDEQIADSKSSGVLCSLHMKATMMKVSDPIIFGHAVRAYFATVFAKHDDLLAQVGADARNGFGDIVAKIQNLPQDQRAVIEKDIESALANGPALAMVDSDRGITNLHVPSDVIIDASIPAMIRSSGQMWNSDGQLQDTKAIIPDNCYAPVFQAVIEDCKANGAYDPTTMGNVSNVGLMAQKAEEYGSHDKTFEVPAAGVVRVVDSIGGDVLIEHNVQQGDVWRACQTKDAPVNDWVKLAVSRAEATGSPAVFWLDESRAHDRQIIEKVVRQLKATEGVDQLDIFIMPPAQATAYSLQRLRAGQDTISVTGNVLRDYLTDLFPILELGTSAKVLSVVPLMAGGGLFETGAGGSAPKHVQQFEQEGHLRWDSLGEFLALAESLRHTKADKARVLGDALDEATAQYLLQRKEPSRKVHELDNRGSHYFVAKFWAQALAQQTQDEELAAQFAPIAQALTNEEETIVQELNHAQGSAQAIGGYYLPNDELADAAMRPSATLNNIIDLAAGVEQQQV